MTLTFVYFCVRNHFLFLIIKYFWPHPEHMHTRKKESKKKGRYIYEHKLKLLVLRNQKFIADTKAYISFPTNVLNFQTRNTKPFNHNNSTLYTYRQYRTQFTTEKYFMDNLSCDRNNGTLSGISRSYTKSWLIRLICSRAGRDHIKNYSTRDIISVKRYFVMNGMRSRDDAWNTRTRGLWWMERNLFNCY